MRKPYYQMERNSYSPLKNSFDWAFRFFHIQMMIQSWHENSRMLGRCNASRLSHRNGMRSKPLISNLFYLEQMFLSSLMQVLELPPTSHKLLIRMSCCLLNTACTCSTPCTNGTSSEICGTGDVKPS